eukprot:2312670-Rhodomonas_salina.1
MVWGWIVRRIEEENEDGAGEVSEGDRRRDVQEGGGNGAGMECDLTAAGAMAGRAHVTALGCHKWPC